MMNTPSFNDLKKQAGNKKKPDKEPVKIALLSDSSSQHLVQALIGTGISHDTNYKIWEAGYDQIDASICDPGSELYTFGPEYIIIIRSGEHLLRAFCKADPESQGHFADRESKYIMSLTEQISGRHHCQIITNTYAEINDAVFGHYANKIQSSFLYQVRKLNMLLMEMCQQRTNIFLLDIASIVAHAGYDKSIDRRMYITADMTFALDLLPLIAHHIHGIIRSLRGSIYKCLIVDLDNTLWGGTIGDDGMDGIQIGNLGIGKVYSELQLWIKQLKQRGIIIAVCSKNTESIALEPFEKHPDMELRKEDIALFVINWENKADNIRYIQQVLQIGLDSMIFIDDNSFEREMVRQAIPEIAIPELPDDPSEYLPYLRSLNLFETASYTKEDSIRTKQYKEESERIRLQRIFTNEDDFLENLGMESEVKSFDSFTIPRVAQLIQRSNQFNLRTRRYAANEIGQLSEDDAYCTFTFSLADRLGDHGLVAAVILQRRYDDTLFIDTWIMSCRVLKRGLEHFILYCLLQYARDNGIKRLTGEYLPTAKNEIVRDLYQGLGFTFQEGCWTMTVGKEIPVNMSHIRRT